MTDLLERLRAANPLVDCAAPSVDDVWQKLDQDRARAAARAPGTTASRHPLGGVRGRVTIAISVLATIAVALASRPGAPSIAARAYAATDSNAVVVHYVEISRVQNVRGLPGWTYIERRADVWLSGSRSHTVATNNIVSPDGRGKGYVNEIAIDGARRQLYQANTIFKGVAAPLGPGNIAGTCVELTSCGGEATDPVLTLRKFYRAGRLRDAGHTVRNGHLLDVIRGRGSAHIRILVDARTFIPVQIEQTFDSPPGRPFITVTTTIDDYERLPLTSQTSRLLVMRPHPHARVACTLGGVETNGAPKAPNPPPRCPHPPS
jgi:hypothetical protein